MRAHVPISADGELYSVDELEVSELEEGLYGNLAGAAPQIEENLRVEGIQVVASESLTSAIRGGEQEARDVRSSHRPPLSEGTVSPYWPPLVRVPRKVNCL